MFLGLGLALLQQLLDQRLVVQGRLQVGLTFQGLLIGIQRGFQLPGAGQGIASIVVGCGAAALGEGLGCCFIVARLVQRHTAPLRVFEVPGSVGRVLLLEQALALLVRAQPQVVEFEGLARLRQGQQ